MRIAAHSYYIICIVLLLPTIANAATIDVNSNLQAAINAASSGDTIKVAPGVYDRIEIAKKLTLIGDGAVIKGNERDACVRILADGVSFSGFVVRNGFYGISLDTVKGCRIYKNTVVYCAQPGIMLKFSNNNIVQGNNASFNGLGGEGWYGIYLTNSNENQVIGNVAYGNGAYGINLFPSCNNNTIRGNVLQGNMYGLYMFTDCSNNLIESNTMSKNTNSGMDIRFNCHDNLILNNTIENNVVAGITLMEKSGSNTIKGNEISGNQRYGIQIQSDSNGNTINNNTISQSQTGIFLDADGNRIYGNNIIENIVQAEDRGTNTWNAAYPVGGNLWSDYIGEDKMGGPGQDKPGSDRFGDTPYKINERSVDKYPIMGKQTRQVTIVEKSISPTSARIGDNIDIKARIAAKYGLAQITVRAFDLKGVEAKAYCRMVQSGDYYRGSLSTALLDPGSYEVVLSARDMRGYELKETLGEIKVVSRDRFESSTSS
ncbi:MAG: nitrous oxide reductase family maturation protein NosD [Methanotrichaceae archaeon]